jgi:acetyl esterase/lipase
VTAEPPDASPLVARMDPRVAAFVAAQPPAATSDVSSREELLAEAGSEAGRAALAAEAEFMEEADDESVAPSAGLRLSAHAVAQPDGHSIRLFVTRPDTDEALACVYYIHGGAMAYLSCTYGNYRAWARLVAARGVAVVMVDYRNCVAPSSVPEVAPYPAGLDDCAAGLAWVVAHARELGVDPARVVVSGESGGGNLTLALGMRQAREGRPLAAGLYAFCPFLLGAWPDERYPSSREYASLLSDVNSNRGRVGYGIDAFDARDPLAWPGFATRDDVAGLAPTVVSVNELDPLRDEGVAFYRLALSAGVDARGRVALGTTHAVEQFPTVCPDVSRSAAADLAAFARGARA